MLPETRINRWLATAVIALALSGCASTGDSEAVSQGLNDAMPEVSAAWQTAQQRTRGVDWISAFEDPVLVDLINEALSNNLDLQAAAAAVDQAHALARQAGAGLLPSINLSSGTSRSGVLESGNGTTASFSGGLQASWEADLWGRIRSGKAQAAASAQAAEADFQFARYSIAASTAVAYFTAIEARQQTELAQENLNLLERTLKIVEVQYEEGLTSAQDLALTRSDIANARDQVTSLEASVRSAVRALELLLGRYPGAILDTGRELPVIPPEPPAGLPADLLERRPDVISAERIVAAAFNAVNVVKAARLPSITLTAGLSGASTELSDVLDPANVAWTTGANLLAPLFDGGRLRENVNIASAQQEGAIANYVSAALRAFSDVEAALDQGRVLATRQEVLIEAEKEASRAFKLAELRYREGEISLLDLLSVQQRVNAARSNLIVLERQILQQRVDLNLALGGAWT